jgi:hypothetical protein
LIDGFFDGIASEGDGSPFVLFAHAQIVRKEDSGDVCVIRVTQGIPQAFRRVSVLFRASHTLSILKGEPTGYNTLGSDVSVVHLSSHAATIKTLQRFMAGVYACSMRQRAIKSIETSSPLTDLAAHAHTFMSKLLDASNSHRTVLYVPDDQSTGNLESVVANWSRQLRQVLGRGGDVGEDDESKRDAQRLDERVQSDGPLMRIMKFWPERATDLRGDQ